MADFGKYLTSLLRRREMKTVCLVLLFVFSVFGDTGEEVSVKEGKNVTLSTDVKQPNKPVRWYFNNTLIALINGEPNSCLYDGEGGIFRGRLEVDYETGSLTITNITTDHTGRYEASIIIRGHSKGTSQNANITSKCDRTKIHNKTSNSGDTIKTFNVNVNGESLKGSGLSPAAVAGIGVGVVVLLVAAAVVVKIRKSSRNDGVEEKNKYDVL